MDVLICGMRLGYFVLTLIFYGGNSFAAVKVCAQVHMGCCEARFVTLKPNHSGRFSNGEREFYQKILSINQVSIQSLLSAEIILKRPGLKGEVYVPSKQRVEASKIEERTAETLSAILNLPVLLVADLPGYGSIPAVDAILFDRNGFPLSNLSFKSVHSRGKTIKATYNQFYAVNVALREHYSQDFFEAKFRPPEDVPGDIKAIPSAVRKLLGIDRIDMRPISVVLDYLSVASAHPTITVDPSAQKRLQIMVNGRTKNEDINLSALERKMIHNRNLLNHWFLFDGTLVSVSAGVSSLQNTIPH